MPQKNNTQLTAEATTIYSKTDPKSIKGSAILLFLKNVLASFLNKADDAKLLGVKEHDVTKPFKAGEITVKNGRIGRARIDTTGNATDSLYDWITPKNLLFEIPEWNSAPKSIGTLVRANNAAWRNVAANNQDHPQDFGYVGVNVPKCYYGEPYLSNSIYIAGMVVLADVDGRKVYLMCDFDFVTLSTNIKNEWNQGKWVFVSQASMDQPYLIEGEYTLKPSDHKQIFTTSLGGVVVANDLPLGFECDLISQNENKLEVIGESAISSIDGNVVIDYGRAKLIVIGNDRIHLSGDLKFIGIE